MYYVYIIRSTSSPSRIYVGITTNIVQRINTHNSGGSLHTKQFRPWEFVMFIGFKSKVKAAEFEKYLKSGSGRAFARKRFL